MNAILVAHYNKFRKDNLPAKSAWYYAKQAIKQVEPQFVIGKLFDYEGFKVKITMKPEECPEIDMFGKFTDKWEKGALLVNRFDRNKYKYFVPEEKESTLKAYYSSVGFSRAESTLKAKKTVWETYKLAKDYSPLIVCVSVYKNGVKLASDSIGGYDDEENAIADIAWFIDETVDTAREVLKQLCTCKDETVTH
jgi:hypothetical protein